MRSWAPAVSTLLLVVSAIVAAQLWPRPDFPPFVMTLEEWSSQRGQRADGTILTGTTVFRIEYHRRDEWTMTVVSDDLGLLPGQGVACRGGVYYQVSVAGALSGAMRDPGLCNGVGRWIHYGIAWGYPWTRHDETGRVEYTDPGERIVFDARTGLPLLYEAGRVGGPVGLREIYRVERWLDGSMPR